MSDKIVVMSEGTIQQIGTPEDIYNEPKNIFVADFVGDSNIFSGIMTGDKRVRFCGGEFECLDEFPQGTHIMAVVRPEDVELVRPEDGIIQAEVTSIIFKGMHYEITMQAGRNEIVSCGTKSAAVGDRVCITLAPDGIHVIKAEDNTNTFRVDVTRDFGLEYNGETLADSQTLLDLFPGSKQLEDGSIVDTSGSEIDFDRYRIYASIQPGEIDMTDNQEEGLEVGNIYNLIYEGDHYLYVIHTESEQDFVVYDEDLWNMGDRVGLIIPVDKLKFSVVKK
jgi:spermidine/putrescine transport system ATP-binding protein